MSLGGTKMTDPTVGLTVNVSLRDLAQSLKDLGPSKVMQKGQYKPQ